MTPENQEEKQEPETLPADSLSSGRFKAGLIAVGVFLTVGGFVSVFMMKDSARQLAGGDNYTQLSANSASYSSGVTASSKERFFTAEESSGERDSSGTSLKPEDKNKEAASVPGNEGGPGMLSGGFDAASAQEGDSSDSGRSGGASVQRQPGGGSSPRGLIPRLTSALSGLMSSGSQSSRTTAFRDSEESETGGAKVVPTGARPSGGFTAGGKTSSMDALKTAAKFGVKGANQTSQDAARGTVARSFVNSGDASMGIDYSPQMNGLDKVSPGSTPGLLRDNLTMTNAKTLSTPVVGKPSLNAQGTAEALKNDAKYQRDKKDESFASQLANSLTGQTAGGQKSGSNNGKDANNSFLDPNDKKTLDDTALSDYTSTEGYGATCGCTKTAPCICQPQSSFDPSQCSKWGPFQEKDPCNQVFLNSFSGGQ